MARTRSKAAGAPSREQSVESELDNGPPSSRTRRKAPTPAPAPAPAPAPGPAPSVARATGKSGGSRANSRASSRASSRPPPKRSGKGSTPTARSRSTSAAPLSAPAPPQERLARVRKPSPPKEAARLTRAALAKLKTQGTPEENGETMEDVEHTQDIDMDSDVPDIPNVVEEILEDVMETIEEEQEMEEVMEEELPEKLVQKLGEKLEEQPDQQPDVKLSQESEQSPDYEPEEQPQEQLQEQPLEEPDEEPDEELDQELEEESAEEELANQVPDEAASHSSPSLSPSAGTSQDESEDEDEVEVEEDDVDPMEQWESPEVRRVRSLSGKEWRHYEAGAVFERGFTDLRNSRIAMQGWYDQSRDRLREQEAIALRRHHETRRDTLKDRIAAWEAAKDAEQSQQIAGSKRSRDDAFSQSAPTTPANEGKQSFFKRIMGSVRRMMSPAIPRSLSLGSSAASTPQKTTTPSEQTQAANNSPPQLIEAPQSSDLQEADSMISTYDTPLQSTEMPDDTARQDVASTLPITSHSPIVDNTNISTPKAPVTTTPIAIPDISMLKETGMFRGLKLFTSNLGVQYIMSLGGVLHPLEGYNWNGHFWVPSETPSPVASRSSSPVSSQPALSRPPATAPSKPRLMPWEYFTTAALSAPRASVRTRNPHRTHSLRDDDGPARKRARFGDENGGSMTMGPTPRGGDGQRSILRRTGYLPDHRMVQTEADVARAIRAQMASIPVFTGRRREVSGPQEEAYMTALQTQRDVQFEQSGFSISVPEPQPGDSDYESSENDTTELDDSPSKPPSNKVSASLTSTDAAAQQKANTSTATESPAGLSSATTSSASLFSSTPSKPPASSTVSTPVVAPSIAQSPVAAPSTAPAPVAAPNAAPSAATPATPSPQTQERPAPFTAPSGLPAFLSAKSTSASEHRPNRPSGLRSVEPAPASPDRRPPVNDALGVTLARGVPLSLLEQNLDDAKAWFTAADVRELPEPGRGGLLAMQMPRHEVQSW